MRALAFQPKHTHVFPQLKQTIKIPFKFIHVVRNPFDIVATQLLRRNFNRLGAEGRKRLFQNQVSSTRNNVEKRALRARFPTDYFSFPQTPTRVSIIG